MDMYKEEQAMIGIKHNDIMEGLSDHVRCLVGELDDANQTFNEVSVAIGRGLFDQSRALEDIASGLHAIAAAIKGAE